MKKRIDVLLVDRRLCASRERAKALIMEGKVFVGQQRVLKAGDTVDESAEIEIRGKQLEYVSRGGLKLEKAIKEFDLALDGFVCADIGASTGGFTDCMLKNGASRVYAVDVGYGQLAWTLRCDDRVVLLERTNARYLSEKEIPVPLDFFSVDVSFISLKLILPAVRPLLSQNGAGVMLIKPQFEAGRSQVGKNGVVRDSAVHISVINSTLGYIADNKLYVKGLTFSPIKGPEGNIEYLVYVSAVGDENCSIDVEKVVFDAHSLLKAEQ